MNGKVVCGLILTLLTVSVFTRLAPAKGFESDSYIIVHALNPEEIEIGSLLLPWSAWWEIAPVEIYDGTTMIGYGAYDNETYSKPIAISPGAHTIRVEFNGMTLEQSVTIRERETKVLTFVFERTEFDISSWINGLGVHGEVAVDASANLSETNQKVIASDGHPDIDLDISYSAYIDTYTEPGKYSDVSFVGEAGVDLTGSSYYEYWRNSFSCLGSAKVYSNQIASYEGTNGQECGFAAPHSEFENWFVQNIQYGWYPEVSIVGNSATWWLFGHQLYPDVGIHEIRVVDASEVYTHCQIHKYGWLWLNQFFGLSIHDPPYWMHTGHPAVSTENFEAEFAGSLQVEMSSVPYDLAGTGIKHEGHEENQPPVASFTYSPENPVVGEEMTFNASASYDPDGELVNYAWDFGDGSSQHGESEVLVVHAYSELGKYTVTLTVVDNEGASGTISLTIEIMILFSYELFIEIDYLEGHAPSQVVLAYIMEYFKELEKEEERINIVFILDEEISLADWNAIDPDYRTSYEERWEFERIYNNQGDDSVIYDIFGRPIDYRLDSKWKWILYGNDHAGDAYGFAFTNKDMGNYIFIAETTCNRYASSHSAETTPDEVETKVLMHELGHSIGILKTYKGGPKAGKEKYDGDAHSVMNSVDKYHFNDVIDERYGNNYWKEKNLLPNYEY